MKPLKEIKKRKTFNNVTKINFNATDLLFCIGIPVL
jgi:hypothetical protein